MLKHLYAKNFILIDEIEIDFSVGLNIITGETGAGKSILIGALEGLLGERLSRDVVRNGADKGIVEGHFVVAKLPEIDDFFNRNELEWYDDSLILRREINANGRSRNFINDSPVTLSVLSELGDLLVDLHGQHEHQLLFQVKKHIDYLDAFGQIHSDPITEQYNRLNDILRSLKKVRTRAEELKKQRDILSYQYNEISAVDPQPEEEKSLTNEERILGNAELLVEKTDRLFKRLYEDEGAVSEILASAEKDLLELQTIDKSFEKLYEQCNQAQVLVEDLSQSLQHYARNVTFDAGRLEEIRQRLVTLNGLKKKYGGSLNAVIEMAKKLKAELYLVDNLDQEIDELSDFLHESRQEFARLCLEINRRRRETAKTLDKLVVDKLAQLGMSRAIFETKIDQNETLNEPYIDMNGNRVQAFRNGCDLVEFLMSTNPGESVKPLAKIASGGEISRIMLALKTLLADADKVPVLIFDEIDNGVSGRIAQIVGLNLRVLAAAHQVICITHLPQIASMSQHHYLVEKEQSENKTRTTIRKLDKEESINQVARLIGGETVSRIHIQSALELIEEANALSSSADATEKIASLSNN
ncbi:DNA repair protein RecN [candidate division KSB1 bacterium]|nr:DNA repair protein RecN [candidate division KSB1 bacterium]